MYDTVEFTHLLLSMLEAYSKGRALTIQTAKTRVVRAKKQQRDVDDDDYGDESEELPDEEATEHVERRGNFVSELA